MMNVVCCSVPGRSVSELPGLGWVTVKNARPRSSPSTAGLESGGRIQRLLDALTFRIYCRREAILEALRVEWGGHDGSPFSTCLPFLTV